VSQNYLQPRSGAVTYSRWPIWSARLGVTCAVAACLPLARMGLRNPHGRETMLMLGLAAGFLLVLFLTWAHETVRDVDRVPRTRIVRAAVTFGASCVALAVFLAGTQADPAHVLSKVARMPRALWPLHHDVERPAIHQDHVGLLPRFSTKLSGAAQAPVSLVFLGSGAHLLRAFAESGWHVAERVTPRTAVRAFVRGVLNRPYSCAPVLPAFLDGRLHDVAFQRTDDGGSSRRRHHARWWLTDFTCEGRPVWVATASFDAGVGIGRVFPLPIHHIHPNIDAERDYIVRSLSSTGQVKVTQEIRVTEPMTGTNAAGDRFFTAGLALVLA
jgi:hypothetical protein